jgi:hypothetical protein
VKGRPGRGHLGGAVLGVLAVVGLGATLSACGNSGTTLAQQACVHIDRSITDLHKSELPGYAAQADGLRQKAYLELRKALPIASMAAFHDGQWQSLMTTISESNRVPETTLITALTAQCNQANSSTFGNPPPPSSIPPPAPVSTSP